MLPQCATWEMCHDSKLAYMGSYSALPAASTLQTSTGLPPPNWARKLQAQHEGDFTDCGSTNCDSTAGNVQCCYCAQGRIQLQSHARYGTVCIPYGLAAGHSYAGMNSRGLLQRMCLQQPEAAVTHTWQAHCRQSTAVRHTANVLSNGRSISAEPASAMPAAVHSMATASATGYVTPQLVCIVGSWALCNRSACIFRQIALETSCAWCDGCRHSKTESARLS